MNKLTLNSTIPTVLSIAGSDPSGGAGIQIDLKTFSAFGCFGMAVITALTAQNSNRVAGIQKIPADFVNMQIETIFEDIIPTAIKTGMLADADIVEITAKALQGLNNIVVDPVMVSTSGHRLIKKEAEETMISELFKIATIVTPNLPEACIITGRKNISYDEIEDVGEEILKMGPQYVLIKGGHGTGTKSTDYLFGKNGVSLISGERFNYEVHGTGCSLSAAIAAGLANKNDMENSVKSAKKFITNGIKNAITGKSGMHFMNPF